jgi:hypothetical protein
MLGLQVILFVSSVVGVLRMDWSILVGLGEPRIESCRLAFRRLSGVVDECMEAPA